ncbi:MAG: transketolase family protein [Lachnospiraceae bacterium]|nr:transketolase family protein [Lachnospiraceae bacterium]
MGKQLREIYGEILKEVGATNNDIVVLDADVSGSTKSAIFGKAYPDRFYNCGISEYAMAGMAAGLAKMGKIPFVNTFAVFISTIGLLGARTFMSYSGLNVKYMGAYGGLSDAYDGATHHALEDIANMRALPGIDVLVPSDAASTEFIVNEAIARKQPMYIRLSRDAMPDCHPEGAKFEYGKGMIVREGTDVTLIGCGIMVSKSMEAAELLAKEGISARVVDMYCIKPIDTELIAKCSKETGAIVTAEEHSVIGGLGAAVAEALVKTTPAPVEMIGVQDTHAESASYKDLFAKYHLNAEDIAEAAKKAIARK